MAQQPFHPWYMSVNDTAWDYPAFPLRGASNKQYKWEITPFCCRFKVNGVQLPSPSDDILAITKRSDYGCRLHAGSYLPGMEMKYTPDNITWNISLDDCKHFLVDLVREGDPDYGALAKVWNVDSHGKAHLQPFFFRIICQLRQDRAITFVPGSEYRGGEYEEPSTFATDEEYESMLSKTTGSTVVEILKKARTLEMVTVIDDFLREHMCKWFQTTVNGASQQHGSCPRSFDTLSRRYPTPPDRGATLLHAMVEGAKGDPDAGPPVLPAHYKQNGTNLNINAHILDATDSKSPEVGNPIFTTPTQLTNAYGLAVFREWQHEKQIYKALRGIRLEAHISFEYDEMQGNRTMDALMMIRADGHLEQRHFPPAGTEIDFILYDKSKPGGEALGIKGYVHENQAENEDLLGIDFNVMHNSPVHRLINHTTIAGARGNSSTASLAKCQVSLDLKSSSSGFRSQLEGLIWQHEHQQPDAASPESACLWRMFFRHERGEPAFVGDALRDFRDNDKIDHKALRERVALRFQSANNEGQIEMHKACLGAMPENILHLEGPVGTGKTTTMTECAFSMSCIEPGCIVTAKTDVAVNIMARQANVIRHGVCNDPVYQEDPFQITVVRVHTTHQERAIRNICLNGGPAFERLTDLQQQSMAYLAFQNAVYLKMHGHDNHYADLIEIIQKLKREDRDEDLMAEFAAVAEDAEYNVVNACTILAATTATLGRLLKSQKYHGATSVFLDEASRLTVPEVFAGLANNHRLKRVVFAGDPNQTGPFPASKAAALNEFGELLSRSVYDHPYIQSLAGQLIRLRKNFRMTPLGIELANIISYSSTPLISGLTGTNTTLQYINDYRHLFANKNLQTRDFIRDSVLFMHVDSPPDGNNEVTGGWNNRAPAENAFQYKTFDEAKDSVVVRFKQPVRNRRMNEKALAAALGMYSELVHALKVSPKNITFLSFYRSFAERLAFRIRQFERGPNGANGESKIFSTEADEFDSPHVSSIDKYQGDENEVVILVFSSFELDTLTWLGKEERINVATSRAKGLLLMIMDWNIMTASMKDRPQYGRTLAKLYKFAVDRKLLFNFDENFPARLEDPRKWDVKVRKTLRIEDDVAESSQTVQSAPSVATESVHEDSGPAAKRMRLE